MLCCDLGFEHNGTHKFLNLDFAHLQKRFDIPRLVLQIGLMIYFYVMNLKGFYSKILF